MRANSVGMSAAVALAVHRPPRTSGTEAQRSAATSAETGTGRERSQARFELTVDRIMRGPDLVGYPPTGLRWSADSQKLYFDWRKPGEDKASTYVVGRDGGAPPKLTDDESKNIPPAAGGRWDKARTRVLFADAGDIVMVDAQSGTRRQITRTTGGEGEPALGAQRHARHLRARRQPVHRAGRRRGHARSDAVDRRRAAPARAAPDRQPAVHPRRGGEADRRHREAAGRAEEGGGGAEEGQAARARARRIGRSPPT